MRAFSTLMTAAFLFGIMLAGFATPTNAALPCNLNDPLFTTASNSREGKPLEPLTLRETLEGTEPADRTDAEPITFDDPNALHFDLIGAGENILRCLDYGQEAALLLNTTPEFRISMFGDPAEVPDSGLIRDVKTSGVYTERVENPLKLADGTFLVEFAARHNDEWLNGEMVFERHNGDFYLSRTFLVAVYSTDGERHEIVIDDQGTSVDHVTAQERDTIVFENNLDESVRIVVKSDDSGKEVFRGNALGNGFGGPAPKNAFFIGDIAPGSYTAEISTTSGELHSVQITIEP